MSLAQLNSKQHDSHGEAANGGKSPKGNEEGDCTPGEQKSTITPSASCATNTRSNFLFLSPDGGLVDCLQK